MTRRDPLAAVLRLRRAALDETQQALAAAYRAEREAGALAGQATRALSEEADAAASLSAGDEAVESYARWLPIGRRAVERARAAQQAAAAELDRTRALLVLTRADVRAVECQIEAGRAASAARATRREQEDADETGRSAHLARAGDRGPGG